MTTFTSRPHPSARPQTAARQGPATRAPQGRPLAAVLLAAAVAALASVVSLLMDTWADEHLFATWVALWAVVFAGSLFLAGTAQRMGQRLMQCLNAWGRERAQARAHRRRLRFGAPAQRPQAH